MNTILLMGAPCAPFTECWCEQNPSHPACQEEPPCWPPSACVPINGGIEYLALAGILWYVIYIKKRSKKLTNYEK